MNFNFVPTGDTKMLLGKLDAIHFEKARKGPNGIVHREWMRDVFKMFAHKAEVTLPQAIQLIKTGDFSRAHRMHSIHWEKIPPKIMGVVDGRAAEVPNPVRTRYEALKNMKPHDNHDFIRSAFSWALSLRHPDQHFAPLKPSDPDIPKIDKRKMTHPDEYHSAHIRRTQAALAVALNPSQENVRELGRSFGL